MDRPIPVLGAAIPGILALAVFIVALINGIGEVQAHIESNQFHAAPRCREGARQVSDCVQVVEVSVEGYIGTGSIVLRVPGYGIVPVPIGETKALGPNDVPAQHPTATLWHGQVMEVDFDGQTIISAENPDLFTVTWPILVPFGFVLTLFAILVYIALAWATGDPILIRLHGRGRPRESGSHDSVRG